MSVYKKQKHSDRYIHFSLHHHPRMMTGVIKCMKGRTEKVCDHHKLRVELKHLTKLMATIEIWSQDNLTNKDNPSPLKPKERPMQDVIPTICIKGMSKKLFVQPSWSKSSFKSHRAIQQALVQLKNSITDKGCGVGGEQSYIGETGRNLQKRLREHKAAIRRDDD